MVNRFALNAVETYRFETEMAAEQFHDELKSDGRFELVSWSITLKEDKKAEAEYYVVKIKKVFNTEKHLVNKYLPNCIENEFNYNLEGGSNNE